MTIDVIRASLRPEVKGALAKDGAIWLATLGGLFHWDGEQMQSVEPWAGRPLRGICKAQGGMLVVDGDRLVICDKAARPVRELPPIPGGEAKSVLVDEQVVFAGGKSGIWRLDGAAWERVHGAAPYEVIGLGKGHGRLHAFVKKQGPGSRPALAISADGGRRWSHAWEGDYADLVRAVSGTQLVTQWGGLRSLGEAVPAGKEPTTAAWIGDGLVATVTGSKLVLRHGGRLRLEIKSPALAEAETLLVLGSRALVAGVQGALLVDLDSGGIRDAFAGVVVPAAAAKLKRLFALGGGDVLATASFGTFVSHDDGAGWRSAVSDWRVLDAVGVAAEGGGRWWLAAQRGLFSSVDGGASWKHAKVAGRPHGFAEFTGVAFAGGRLALASKAGLFVSGPGGIKDLRAVPELGRRLIEGVVADGEAFWATDRDGQLFRFDPGVGKAEFMARLSGGKAVPVACEGDGLLLSTGRGLSVWRDGGLTEFLLPAPDLADLHAVAGGGRVLLWSRSAAWLRAGGTWAPVADWPAGVKSAALLDDGDILATDRSSVFRRKAA